MAAVAALPRAAQSGSAEVVEEATVFKPFGGAAMRIDGKAPASSTSTSTNTDAGGPVKSVAKAGHRGTVGSLRKLKGFFQLI